MRHFRVVSLLIGTILFSPVYGQLPLGGGGGGGIPLGGGGGELPCGTGRPWRNVVKDSIDPYLFTKSQTVENYTLGDIFSQTACDSSLYSGDRKADVEISADKDISDYMYEIYCGQTNGPLLTTAPVALSNTDSIIRCDRNQRSYVTAPASCSVFPIAAPTVQCATILTPVTAKPLCVCNSCGDGFGDTAEQCDAGTGGVNGAGAGCSAQCTFESGVACNATAPPVVTSYPNTNSQNISTFFSNTCGNGLALGVSAGVWQASLPVSDPLCSAIIAGFLGTAVYAIENGAGTYGAYLYPGGLSPCQLQTTTPAEAVFNIPIVVACKGPQISGVTDTCGVCTGDGSSCCGNGIVNTEETCDDTNTASGDGCSATCSIESGVACTDYNPTLQSGITSAFLGTPFMDTACGAGNYLQAEGPALFAEIGGNLGSVTPSASATCAFLQDAFQQTPTLHVVILSVSGTTTTYMSYSGAPTCGVIAQPSANTVNAFPGIYAYGLCRVQGVRDNCGVCAGDNQSCCGDGIRQPAEGCDDGNKTPGDGCSATCTQETGYACTPNPRSPIPASVCFPTCGDETQGAGETCDDGNRISGDGCSSTCQTEASPVCGDSVVTGPTETCDDGNAAAGDGCSASCQIEAGYLCLTPGQTCVPSK